MRLKREDAELKLRSEAQLQGKPATVEGYKSSPTWVLMRHMTKYQVTRQQSKPCDC